MNYFRVGDNRYGDNRQTGWGSGPPSKTYNSGNRNDQSGWNNRPSDSR